MKNFNSRRLAKIGNITSGERIFLLTQIVFSGKPTKVKDLFKREFGKDISLRTIHNIRYNRENEKELDKVRKEYESKINNEIFFSKRRRVESLTDIYDELIDTRPTIMRRQDLRLAGEMVMHINTIVDPKENKNSINILSINQTNEYANMTLPQIQEEKKRLVIEQEES